MTKRALLEKINDKVFPDGKMKLSGRQVIVKTTTGAIASAYPVGTLCWNTFDNHAHICTVASGTWVKLHA